MAENTDASELPAWEPGIPERPAFFHNLERKSCRHLFPVVLVVEQMLVERYAGGE